MTLNMALITLICLIGSNNTSSCNKSGFHTFYISCTVILGFQLIFKYKTKSRFHGEGVEQSNG